MMITRETPKIARSHPSLSVLTLIAFAFGVLAASVAPSDGGGPAVADLLHRAQFEADASRFSQLIVAVEGKAGRKDNPNPLNVAAATTGDGVTFRTEAPAAPATPPRPAAASTSPPPKSQPLASLDVQAPQPKVLKPKARVTGENAKTIWMTRGRAWVERVASNF